MNDMIIENKCIIHFTNCLSVIESILQNNCLKLKYCEEVFDSGEKRISSAAHPMVCFSEYSYDELLEKEITYGEYGIAFSKAWAENNRIHPVLYFDKNSIVAEAFAKLLIARQNYQSSKLPKRLRKPVMEVKCFIKNTYGYNSHFKILDFNFREENEWRFVPTKEQIGNNLISQNRSTYLKSKSKHNKKLIDFPLPFSNTDIEKVYVKREEEITKIAENFSLDIEKIEVCRWKYKAPGNHSNLPKNKYELLGNK